MYILRLNQLIQSQIVVIVVTFVFQISQSVTKSATVLAWQKNASPAMPVRFSNIQLFCKNLRKPHEVVHTSEADVFPTNITGALSATDLQSFTLAV